MNSANGSLASLLNTSFVPLRLKYFAVRRARMNSCSRFIVAVPVQAINVMARLLISILLPAMRYVPRNVLQPPLPDTKPPCPNRTNGFRSLSGSLPTVTGRHSVWSSCPPRVGPVMAIVKASAHPAARQFFFIGSIFQIGLSSRVFNSGNSPCHNSRVAARHANAGHYSVTASCR